MGIHLGTIKTKPLATKNKAKSGWAFFQFIVKTGLLTCV